MTSTSRGAGATIAALVLICLPTGRGAAAQAGGITELPDSVSHARSVEMPEWRNAAVALGLAEQYRGAGRLAEALEAAKRAEELGRRPKWPRQYYPGILLQGRILLDMGRYREALPLLTVLEGVNPTTEPLQAEVALCRLKLGDIRGARAYDVQTVLAERYGESAPAELPGDTTPTKLEASLWLDRCSGSDGALLKSQWAMRAAHLAPRCVAANWLAAFSLGCLGQRASERRYLLRAAAGTACRLQADARQRLGWRTAEECKDRFPQGTMPPPPGEGIAAVPDP